MKPRKILICGLPGSGKTTLARELQKLIPGSLWYDGDVVRGWSFNHDFTLTGRHNQACLMKNLCDSAVAAGHTAIASFVCPTPGTHGLFAGDKKPFVVFMDTVVASHYQDTNKMFKPPPDAPDYTALPDLSSYVRLTPQETAAAIVRLLDTPPAKFDWKPPAKFDWKAPTATMIGRYQPWHEGHRGLFEAALGKWKQVCIMVRTMPIDEKNPLTYEEVINRIHADLQPNFAGRYHVTSAPNTVAVVYGRNVGYAVERIKLDKETESISATEIRNRLMGEGSEMPKRRGL